MMDTSIGFPTNWSLLCCQTSGHFTYTFSHMSWMGRIPWAQLHKLQSWSGHVVLRIDNWLTYYLVGRCWSDDPIMTRNPPHLWLCLCSHVPVYNPIWSPKAYWSLLIWKPSYIHAYSPVCVSLIANRSDSVWGIVNFTQPTDHFKCEAFGGWNLCLCLA